MPVNCSMFSSDSSLEILLIRNESIAKEEYKNLIQIHVDETRQSSDNITLRLARELLEMVEKTNDLIQSFILECQSLSVNELRRYTTIQIQTTNTPNHLLKICLLFSGITFGISLIGVPIGIYLFKQRTTSKSRTSKFNEDIEMQSLMRKGSGSSMKRQKPVEDQRQKRLMVRSRRKVVHEWIKVEIKAEDIGSLISSREWRDLIIGFIIRTTLITPNGQYPYNLRAHHHLIHHTQFAEQDEWEIRRQDLKFLHSIGYGSFGQVHLAEIYSKHSPNHQRVAVKSLRQNAKETELQDLIIELVLLKILGQFSDHRGKSHVISLIGCCTSRGELSIITEYCALGSLKHFLPTRRPLPIRQPRQSSRKPAEKKRRRKRAVLQKVHVSDAVDLTNFSIQITWALEYLHANNIIHRDLCARNTLVQWVPNGTFSMKICDFGLSRTTSNAHQYYRQRGRLGDGPLLWQAPETLETGIYTQFSDRWSMGVLLYEIYSYGQHPYMGMKSIEVAQFIRNGHRLASPSYCPEGAYALMKNLWSLVPEERVSMTEASTILQTLHRP